MTLQSLGKILDKYDQQLGSINTQQLELLRGLPFYNFQDPTADTNTFNHRIGLPRKNGVEFPLFDYEQLLCNELQSHKHLWIKKATGLGVTEFMLRYMAWLCLRNSQLQYSQMCIVTGPRLELAIGLIDRMKQLFHQQTQEKFLRFDTKETVLELNGVTIEAYPSHHLDAMRGIKDVSFILLDEGDFFPPGQQQDARDVSERYIAKSNPWIVMVSTPNAPAGLFERMELEPEATCIYKRLKLGYTYGLDKIFSRAEIKKAKASPSFEREYNLKHLGGIGNAFAIQDIDAAIEDTYSLDDTTSRYFPHWIAVDPGYGSSALGICIVQWKDDKLEVVYADEFERMLYTDSLKLIRQLVQKYHACKVYIDASASHLIHELKHGYNEYISYEKLRPDVLERQISSGCGEPLIVPINFQQLGKVMMKHSMKIMAKRRIRIDKSFDKLIISLKSCTLKDD